MHDLVDEEELGRRIDAVPRILKPEMLDKEQFCPDDKNISQNSLIWNMQA